MATVVAEVSSVHGRNARGPIGAIGRTTKRKTRTVKEAIARAVTSGIVRLRTAYVEMSTQATRTTFTRGCTHGMTSPA